jgi:hypothetical protein
MVSKTFAISFYLKKPKNYSKGPVPIYMRITVNCKRAELSTKEFVMIWTNGIRLRVE